MKKSVSLQQRRALVIATLLFIRPRSTFQIVKEVNGKDEQLTRWFGKLLGKKTTIYDVVYTMVERGLVEQRIAPDAWRGSVEYINYLTDKGQDWWFERTTQLLGDIYSEIPDTNVLLEALVGAI
jgi:hypothetical protein